MRSSPVVQVLRAAGWLGAAVVLVSASPSPAAERAWGSSAPSGTAAPSGAGAGATRRGGDPTEEATVPRAPISRPVSGPVDPDDYVVGPGDVFALTVGAESLETVRAIVGPEGQVIVPGVSAIPVSGLTLRAARERIRTALAEAYRSADLTVALAEPRLIAVHVVGSVEQPGVYWGTALDRTSRLVGLAGHPVENASRRNVRVLRRDGSERRADLLRYERLGDLAANPTILDGDVIRVPGEDMRIQVGGAVRIPGTYEFVPGDTIEEMIALAGGRSYGALMDSVEVRRFVDTRRTETILVSRADTEWPLRDGDQVFVRSDPDFRAPKQVSVEGEVRFPGPYGINEGEDTLLDVLERAGGFTEQASLTEALLVRTAGTDKVDLEFERLKLIPVEYMSKSEYAYFKGKSRERRGVVVVDFARLEAGDEGENRLLSDADRIIVPKVRETITVSGSVTHPGLVTYVPGRDGRYYLAEAGGYSSGADRGKVRVIQGGTGEWESLGDAGEIVPGDEIWVPEKPERNWWDFAQEAVRFAASVATVYLVIDQATN